MNKNSFELECNDSSVIYAFVQIVYNYRNNDCTRQFLLLNFSELTLPTSMKRVDHLLLR